MRSTLSKEEIVEILREAKNPYIKTTLKLINNGVDIATALLVGIVSLAEERDRFQETKLQREMSKRSDVS